MSVAPQESIHVILHRRLSELEAAIEVARVDLKTMEDERDLVSKIIRENRLQKSGPPNRKGRGSRREAADPRRTAQPTPEGPEAEP